MAAEYWAHHYYDNPHQDEVEDDDFDLDAILEEIERTADDTDQWEEVELNDNQDPGTG